MKELRLTARLRVKKGMEGRGRKELSWLVPRSRADKGCLQYDLHQGLEDKNCFMFFERWENQAALDAHKDMPFMKEFFQRNADMFDGSADVTLWEKVVE